MSATSNFYTFDPAEVELSIGGVVIESYGSDNMITLTPNEDRAAVQAGITGDTTVNKSRKLQGTLEVTVQAASLSDATFDQLGQIGNNFAVPLVLSVPSANKTLYANAWYQAQPTLVIGSQIDDRTHVIGITNSSLSLIDSANSVISTLEGVFD